MRPGHQNLICYRLFLTSFSFLTMSAHMSFISPTFTMEVLQTIQGYSLQAFASGRFKLSLHTTASHRSEYYAVAPKRDREAYQRQKLRSEHQCPEHFAAVEALLSERAAPRIFRLHEKTNSNDTADNAHILLDAEHRDACLILGEVLHFWPLPEEVSVVRDFGTDGDLS